MPTRSRTGILLRAVNAPENSFANTTKSPLRFGVLGCADINQNGGAHRALQIWVQEIGPLAGTSL
jgi:hypothetical protein